MLFGKSPSWSCHLEPRALSLVDQLVVVVATDEVLPSARSGLLFLIFYSFRSKLLYILTFLAT